MSLREKIVNALGGQIVRSSHGGANDFLRYGNKTETLYPNWSQVKMSDRDMYKGYAYAAITRRANGVADIAMSRVRTKANKETLEAFKKLGEEPIHPYLKLIRDSREFTEKEFWSMISIYLDLAGRYYIGCVRKAGRSNSRLPSVMSDVKKFVLLNPYEVNRVIDPNTGEVSGYIERKKDGRERVWDNYQIIEIKEFNPFDWSDFYSVTDAAKENIYTLRQSGDYTAKSLDGNLKTPGIIATDIQLSPEEFADFRSRIMNSREGEPIFANGGGHVDWEPMTVDLDKAALGSVNEMNRSELFSTMGMSKTTMGIEESGTTRETARVQSENAATKTYKPRVDLIIGSLAMDYKKRYQREFQMTGYDLTVDSVVEEDYDSSIKAVELRSAQAELAESLIGEGYSADVAAQFVEGKIELKDLVASERKKVEQDDGDSSDDSGTGDDNDNVDSDDSQNGRVGGDRSDANNEVEEVSINEAKIDSRASQSVVEAKNSEGDDVDDDKLDLDNYRVWDLSDDDVETLNKAYSGFLEDVRKVESETVNAAVGNVTKNDFNVDGVVSDDEKTSLIDKFVKAYKKYWWIIFPLFAKTQTNLRREEFGYGGEFKTTREMEKRLDKEAETVGQSHIGTVLNDVVNAANKRLKELTDFAAVDLIREDYEKNPTVYVDYFVSKPSSKDIQDAISQTDILESREDIYRLAQEKALEGHGREQIARAIRDKYEDISDKRATTIARNETSRIYNLSQYEADSQFLDETGLKGRALKYLYSRTGDPCEICQAIIDKGAIPFAENFVDKGETINAGGKMFTANYEAISSGTVHVNCNCRYVLVFDNETSGGTQNSFSARKSSVNELSQKVLNEWIDEHTEDECSTVAHMMKDEENK